MKIKMRLTTEIEKRTLKNVGGGVSAPSSESDFMQRKSSSYPIRELYSIKVDPVQPRRNLRVFE